MPRQASPRALLLVAMALTGCPSTPAPTPEADLDVGDGDLDADVDQVEADVEQEVEADVEREGQVGWPCDVVSGEGCEADELCTLYTLDSVVYRVGCAPLEGETPIGPFGACDYGQREPHPDFGLFERCAPGYACTQFSRCERLCLVGDPWPCEGLFDGEDGICFERLIFRPPMSGLGLCTEPVRCDPLCQDCPDPYDLEPLGFQVGCYLLSDAARAEFHCDYYDRWELDGEGVDGEPCVSGFECRPGLECFYGRCRRDCSLGDGGCGPVECLLAGESCQAPLDHLGQPWFPERFGEAAGLGLCLPDEG